MMPYRLFLVEDDPGIADAVCAQAEAGGLTARKVQNFRSVMEEFRSCEPHIVILDIKLPFFSGYHWCTEIRRESKVPIVFLSSA
ncbi:MAG: response regulator, partial [Clostridia bacterium]|nr:response regulator [Clostridia bacterium]